MLENLYNIVKKIMNELLVVCVVVVVVVLLYLLLCVGV